jgi:hypothetical protein
LLCRRANLKRFCTAQLHGGQISFSFAA